MDEIIKKIQSELLKYNHYVDITEIQQYCKNDENTAIHILNDIKQNKKNSITVRCCRYIK